MRSRPAATLQVSSSQSLNGQRLVGGPLRLMGWSFNDGSASSDTTVDQSAAAPGAGATIASVSLGNGQYTVEWTLELSGTIAAADADNVQLFIGGTLIATSVNAGVAGTYPQEEAQADVIFGPLTLAWKAIGAATAGSTYKIEANVIPASNSTATIKDGSGAVGFSMVVIGGVDNEWFGDDGIAIDTELSVQTTLGLIQGVMWYFYAPDDREVPEQLPVAGD